MRKFVQYIFFIGAVLHCLPAYAKVTVALITPKAEEYKQQGDELEKGVKQAIDEINNNGGLLKEKIALLTIDDQCNDSIAVSTAQMLSILKKRNIKLVIGPYCANAFDKIADIYANAKIFQIIPTTVNYSQAKTIKKGLVKMLGYTNQQAIDFFKFYNERMAGKQLAIVSNKDESESMAEAEAILQEFQKHGKASLTKLYTYDMTDNDYKKLAQKVLADNNDMAFLLGTAKNIRKTAKALRSGNNNFIVFTNKYAATKHYFDYLDELADGTYFMELRGCTDDPDFAETLVKLRLSGIETEGLSLYGYEAINLWKSLVEKAKSFEYGRVATYVNDKNISTEFGNKMFHNGAPKASEPYAIYQFKSGKYEKLY
ncbi:MAG: amino acid ABC transporter substrate-binding protein [Alphaproteobacteria bacterium]|nr:amino acid ABC transporter substrate-binding protein [Alphaproteobacteria bacterium]